MPELQKPKNKSKLTIAIIAAAVIVAAIAVALLLLTSKKSGKIDYSLIPVGNDDGKWGYIDRKGSYAVNPQFDDAGFFSGGLAKIKSDDGKTGYIDKNGKYVIQPAYKDGTAFVGGLAFVVAEGGLPTCIDRKGNAKFTLNSARYVSGFSEGLAMFVTEAGEYGFVDRNGNVVINAQFEGASPFAGKFARIRRKGDTGFIDKTGMITVNPQFSGAQDFSEGKAAFYNGEQWGYIDEKGSYLINPMYDYADRFSEGLAAVKQGRSYGYVDKGGKLAVNPQFDDASAFSEGLAAVKSAGKYGYIGKDGKYAINPQFEYAGDFQGGIALVRSADKWGFINKKGQYTVNPQFRRVKSESFADTRDDLIESDYYDTSEFIRLFFGREAGNSFDGVDASTTLEKLSEHPVYGPGLNARTSNSADYRQSIPLTNDISIGRVEFIFENFPIYEYGYNRTQKWNFGATPDAIVYRFDLGGKAWEKRHVVINALKTEIENRCGQPMEGNGDNYYLIRGDGKLGFIIKGTELTVKFSKNNPATQTAQNGVNIPKTQIRTSDDIYNNNPRMTPAERDAFKVDRFKTEEVRTADNNNLIKGDRIYRNQAGSLNLIYLIQPGNGIGLWAILVSYDPDGNYIDDLAVGGGWVESELHSIAVIEGNRIVISYCTYDDEEKIPDSVFVIQQDLSFTKVK